MNSYIAFSYLVSAVLFILSLYGLSSQKTSRFGNYCGMSGMGLAIITTFFLPQIHHEILIILAIAIGGTIGYFIAKTVKMTAMPQLVAGFHSLVGLAAVLIAMAALWSPSAFRIVEDTQIKTSSLIEMGLGLVIGAITFTGSIVAFLKLNGNMKSRLSIFKNPQKSAKIIASVLGAFLLLFFVLGSKFILVRFLNASYFMKNPKPHQPLSNRECAKCPPPCHLQQQKD